MPAVSGVLTPQEAVPQRSARLSSPPKSCPLKWMKGLGILGFELEIYVTRTKD
jgi:hypothetical protein